MPYEGRKGLRDGLLRVLFLQMFLCHKLKKSQIQAVDSLNQRLSSMVTLLEGTLIKCTSKA